MADTEAIRGLLQDGDKVIIPYVNPATKTNEGIVKVDDALSNDSENPVQNKVINTALSGKQATLVSGTNIKTVNNTSVLGSGNIAVQAVINDLSDIRDNATAGKSASDTISGYGDVVTHDADEFMPADTVIPVVNNATLTIQKNGVAVDTFTANASADKIINITVPTKASDVSALPSSTKYGASLSMSINSTTYVLTAQMKDQDGNNLGTAQTVDLPIESLVMDVDFDEDTNELVIKLQSGTTTRVPIGSIIGGLQSEINADNKLDADFIEDTLTTKKLVTTAEKNTWNGKQNALVSGTNIKTINGNSLLGSGNITIEAGSDITVDSALSTTSTNPVQNKVVTTALNGKFDSFTLSFAGNWSGGVHAVNFVTIDYSECNSEQGVFIKFSMVNSHGNGQAGRFLQDIVLNVKYTGEVAGTMYRYFAVPIDQTSSEYYGSHYYGDVFWVNDTTNKIVKFYVLMHQFSYTYATPYFRLNASTKGVITQPSGRGAEEYSEGTRTWATIYNLDENVPTKTSELTNDSGYITGISSSDVTTALGYTPYNATNPNGYTSNKGTVTKVNNTSPDNSGNVTISIPSAVTESTVSGWGFTKNTGTVTKVNNVSPVNGNVTLSIPDVEAYTAAEVQTLWGSI